MSLPLPPVALEGHCSVVYNNTLYTYQPDAFQSLSLGEGAQWSKLPMGVSVEGASCIWGPGGGQDLLYIIGGSPSSSAQNSTGMQFYSFANQSWQSVHPQVPVAQNRQWQGAAYLNQSSSILVYAGSQDGNRNPSSQTFMISTTPPYVVQAFSSDAPPVIEPLLLQWNESHAVLLGGDPDNRAVFLFGPEEGWQNLNVTLPKGLKNSSVVQTALLDGTDGSKVLQIFDLSQSPNSLSTFTLQAPTDQTISPSASSSNTSNTSNQTSQAQSRTRRKRIVTLSGFPAYNRTLAPQITRTGFSLAEDPSGKVIISGGADDQNPLELFSQTNNEWFNATEFFVNPNSEPKPQPSSTTSSPAASLTANSSPSSSSSASNNNARNRSLTILGGVLGAIFGIAALLILALCLLRCARRRERAKHKRHKIEHIISSGGDDDLDAASGVPEAMSERRAAGHRPMNSANSATSLAIMSGRATSQSTRSPRAPLHKSGDSGGSAKSFFNRTKSPHAPSPPTTSGGIVPGGTVALSPPEPRTEPRTDTGWSKYFTDNSATNLASIPPRYSRRDSNSRPTTYTSTSRSDYTNGSGDPHESAEVPPLNLRSSADLLSAFPSHRGSNNHCLDRPGVAIGDESCLEPPSPSSVHSEVSRMDEDDEDEYIRKHGPLGRGTESWTPVATSDRGSTWDDRPESSIYGEATMFPHPGDKVRIPKPVNSGPQSDTTPSRIPGPMPRPQYNWQYRPESRSYANSKVFPHPGEKVPIPDFPGVPSTRSSKIEDIFETGQGPSAYARDYARGIVRKPSKALPDVRTGRAVEGTARPFHRQAPLTPEADAEITDAAGHFGRRRRVERGTEDMSWLNLGR